MNLIKKEITEIGAIEKALIGGDLSGLKPEERVVMYRQTCDSLGLNWMTCPFAYIKAKDGKLKLYALKDCTEQLRQIHGVNIVSLDVANVGPGIYAIRVTGTNKSGRCDSAIGAVSVAGKSGEDLANAVMKAETKAKRRLTLSICGLGTLDESELDGMRGSSVISAEEAHSQLTVTGELVGEPQEVLPPPIMDRYFRFEQMADEQRDFLASVGGDYREDIRAWVLPSTLPSNLFAKLRSSEISSAQIEAELLQEAAAAASGVGDIPMDPEVLPREPRDTPLQKAQKRAAAMEQPQHVSGALAKLEALKQAQGGK